MNGSLFVLATDCGRPSAVDEWFKALGLFGLFVSEDDEEDALLPKDCCCACDKTAKLAELGAGDAVGVDSEETLRLPAVLVSCCGFGVMGGDKLEFGCGLAGIDLPLRFELECYNSRSGSMLTNERS